MYIIIYSIYKILIRPTLLTSTLIIILIFNVLGSKMSYGKRKRHTRTIIQSNFVRLLICCTSSMNEDFGFIFIIVVIIMIINIIFMIIIIILLLLLFFLLLLPLLLLLSIASYIIVYI